MSLKPQINFRMIDILLMIHLSIQDDTTPYLVKYLLHLYNLSVAPLKWSKTFPLRLFSVILYCYYYYK